MISKNDAYRGCLLGLAIGDAMGYPVDTKTWNQIREDYGPYGLMGYDLRNGYAEVSSHTQIASFSCNGLLLGLTRGQMLGKMAPFVKYIEVASREELKKIIDEIPEGTVYSITMEVVLTNEQGQRETE